MNKSELENRLVRFSVAIIAMTKELRLNLNPNTLEANNPVRNCSLIAIRGSTRRYL